MTKTSRKKKQPRPGFENYELVKMPDVVTFGTSLFMRKDKRALKIVFPAGQMVAFAPEEEIKDERESNPNPIL
jgi:hypothetical protein